MSSLSQTVRRLTERLAGLSSPVLFCLFFATVALSHLTLLRLPYYWDEGGYYIPAALDFYHRFTLIPEFTNAHPPLPNVVLGTLWHITGYHILATRLLICAIAAAALVAVFRMAQWLLDAPAAVAVTLLVAIYPIWFAQSTLAHADIFAAAFTLWAFALYFRAQSEQETVSFGNSKHIWIAILFSLAALSKETAIVEPATLAAIQLVLLLLSWNDSARRRANFAWLAALAFPVLPLAAWFGYHRLRTGFTFGNPEYLRYNATANFTFDHIFTAFRYRAIHLFWQRDIWIPLLLAVLYWLVLPKRQEKIHTLTASTFRIIGVLIVANWLAFSVLGGALLTRYLLPVYVLLMLACVAIWRSRTNYWPALAAITSIGFLVVLWWNPPAAFAPEDNLTYRDMIVLHQEAITFIDQHYPQSHVLTSWPAAAELFRPDLGYTDHRIPITPLDNFSAAEIAKAAQEPEKFDTALVFSKNFFPPALARHLFVHPDSSYGRDFVINRDLTPGEIAIQLSGTIVFQDSRNGEWVAVLRFPRRYDALLIQPHIF